MRRLIVALSLLLTVAACTPPRPPNIPAPPVVVAPTVSVLTVEVEPKTAIVRVQSVDGTQIKERPTRSDGLYVEEFTFGSTYRVTARATSYEPSAPFTMTFDWERHYVKITLTKTPAPPVPTFTIRNRQFYDGDTLYVQRWVSGLTLLVRTPEQQGTFLDWAAKTGFNGVRVFAGALTWAGQTPDGARAALPALLDLAAARGLTVEVTAITDSATGYDAREHVRLLAGLLTNRRGVVFELANEVGHPTQAANITADNLRQWGAALVPAGLPWAVGAAGVDEPDAAGVYPTSGGSYSTAHLDRGRDLWNQFRRVREIYAIVESTKAPALNNEPLGCAEPGTAGQRFFDPAMAFVLGALDRGFGVGGVHHSQAGLMAQLPGPVQQACADAYVAAHAAVDAVLPGVVGQYKNVGHAGGPFAAAGFVDGGQADGVIRAYAFIDGNRGVVVLMGLKGDAALVWANGWRLIRTVASRTAQDGRQIVVLEIGR